MLREAVGIVIQRMLVELPGGEAHINPVIPIRAWVSVSLQWKKISRLLNMQGNRLLMVGQSFRMSANFPLQALLLLRIAGH